MSSTWTLHTGIMGPVPGAMWASASLYMKVTSHYIFHLIKSVYCRLCFIGTYVRGVLVAGNMVVCSGPF